MNLVTYFDELSWSETKESWNSTESSPLVFFNNLSPTSKREIFSRFSNNCELEEFSFFKICCQLVDNFIEDDKDYLLIDPRTSKNVFTTNVINSYHNKDVFFNLKKIDDENDEKEYYSLAESVFNVYEKADLIKEFKNTTANLGGIFDSSLILGTSDFWISFVGFQKMLVESNYLINSRNFNHLVSKRFGDVALFIFYLQSKSFSFEFKDLT